MVRSWGIVLSGKYLVRENVATVEDYVYDAVGRLADVRRDGIVINSRRYDLAGRVAETGLMTRSTADGLAAAVEALGGSSETHVYAYNWIGQITSQQDNSYVKDRATGDNVRNIWFGEGYDPVGNLRDYTVSPIKGDNTVYTISYEFTNGYRETGNRHNRSNTNNVSGYDVNGNRTSVTDTGTGKLVRQMAFDADGHVQSRFDFVDGKAVERFSLIVNGQVLGEEDRKSTTVLGSTYAGVTASGQGAPPAFYSVQGANESLQSIAQSIWGDSKLWYLIADANGIDGATRLAPGDQLRIPTRVNTVHNDYATFRPYDAAEALGNNAPAMPPPSQGGGCGAVGTLIMIVVAVVVTIYTAGAMASGSMAFMSAMSTGASAMAGGVAGFGVASGALAAAAGSVASQAVGMAIGAQDRFDWKGVALSAIGGGVGVGVGAYANGLSNTALLGTTTNGGTLTFSQIAARAAVSSTVSQGVGMVAGLQSGFAWRNVAVSYASAYAGAAAGDAMGGALKDDGLLASVLGKTNDLAVRTVSGFAAGATASILRGGKIDVARIATDAFGNALGSSLAASSGPTPDLSDEQWGRIKQDVMSGERFAANDQVVNPINPLQQDVLRLDAGSINGKEQSDVFSFVSKYMDAHPEIDVSSASSADLIETAYNRSKLTDAQLRAESAGLGPLTAAAAEEMIGQSGSWNIGTRAMGLVQLAGGAATAFASGTAIVAGGALAPETLGAGLLLSAAGYAGWGFGADQASAGLQTFLTGQATRTVIGQGIEYATGASPQVSEFVSGALTVSPMAASAYAYTQTTRAMVSSYATSRATYSAPAIRPNAANPDITFRTNFVGPHPENTGPVWFKAPPNATPAQVSQVQAYIAGSNEALLADALSPTGRVSTTGKLSQQSSRVAALEKQRATAAGTPYGNQQAGHVPDTTWNGVPTPHSWLPLDPVVNQSLGGQARGYAIGYKPWVFLYGTP